MNNEKNIIEENTNNNNNNNLIKLYPFNGRSRYLIDKFYIIGYNYFTLHKLLIDNIPKSIEQDNEKEKEAKALHQFNLEEEPDILNEITSDFNKVGLPNETILNMIYPKKLNFYYNCEDLSQYMNKTTYTANKNMNSTKNFSKIDFKKEMNSQNFPKSYKVVFSSNPQSENNSKKSINGFAYIFYKKFVEKKIYEKRKYTYYIPYTFCIISEFPYFNSFYKLCKCIKNFYCQNAIYIPIEFLIYNIVSLSPSPLNSDVILDLKSSCDQYKSFGNFNNAISNFPRPEERNLSNNEITTIKTLAVDKEARHITNSKAIRNTIQSFAIENNPEHRKKITSKKLNIPINNLYIKEEKKDESNWQVIKFKCLSGYPLIQYNLSKVLLNNLTPEQVIVIFLYTFLEKDVIFFSKDIEYLTLTLNAYLNLNFPLNDEKYYFIGTAISFEDFSYGNSEFGLKNHTSIIGINDPYRPDYKNKNLKIQDHLVIDLDKGEIHPGMDENNNNINEKNKKLVKFIKRASEGYEEEKNKNNTFYQAIKKLSERLKKIYENMLDMYKKENNNGKYLDYDIKDENKINNNNSRTSTSSDNSTSINTKNREIQEAFYEFVHIVCLYFYENLSIKAQEDEQYKTKRTSKNSTDKNKESCMNVIFNKDYESQSEYTYTEEELIFFDELTETMKFQSFVYGFLQSYNPIDLYKIPLTFTEEFLSIICRKKELISQIKNKITFFQLIDSLYSTGRKIEFKKVNFDLINFNYFKKYKEIFDREIQDKSRIKYLQNNRNLIKYIGSKNEKEKLKLEVNNQKVLTYQTYELDDELLLKYLHFIKNLDSKEYSSAFYGSFFIEENILNNIYINNIETRIENYCLRNKILTNSDICCANIILLFTLGLKSLRETMDCQTFLGILFQDFTVFRKYYSILLRMIYRLYKDPKNKRNVTSTLCYYPCINSIRVKKLVPNEDLLIMINQFNKININEFNFQEEEKKDEIKKDEKLKDVKLYGEELEEIQITPDNLYTYNNFTKNRFVNEKEILISINKFKKSDKTEVILKTGEIIIPKIRFNNGIHKIESFFLSQKVLLESLINEFNNYIEDLDDNKLGAKLILDACLNIFIFMRNSEEFQGKDDIFEVLQSIFYIFMNQLFILKSNNKN